MKPTQKELDTAVQYLKRDASIINGQLKVRFSLGKNENPEERASAERLDTKCRDEAHTLETVARWLELGAKEK